MRVSAPGSSANVGSGFDAVAIAVTLPFDVADAPADDLLAAEPGHPVVRASVAAGGPSSLWWRSPIPSGRGLGFSGAARVAGAYLATRQRGLGHEEARSEAFVVAAELEGHADNAAASAFGGVVVTAGGRVVPVVSGVAVRVVAWSPATSTSTDASRGRLPTEVPLADAAFNVGRAALFVAGLVAGDWPAMAEGVADRLHQPTRLASAGGSAAVLGALRGVGAGVAWLSGSGPTVAALVSPDEVDDARTAVASVTGDDGTVRVLDLDLDGVVERGARA